MDRTHQVRVTAVEPAVSCAEPEASGPSAPAPFAVRTRSTAPAVPVRGGLRARIRRALDPSGATGTVGVDGGVLDTGASSTIQRLRGGGRPMEERTLARMQSAFRTDLSHLRIHDDAQAAGLSASMQARAFTTGTDIFFGRGQFAPHTPDGEHVLAHEIAHTLQPDDAMARRALSTAPVPTAVGVHSYAQEQEDKAPRGTNKAPQAPAGHYRFLGGNVFESVQWDGARWIAALPGFFFHHASSGTMRVHPHANPTRGAPQAWNPPAPTSSNAGSAPARSDDDMFPLGWAVVPGATDQQVAEATELARRLGFATRVTDPTGWQLVPTLEGSPLVLFMQVGEHALEGADFAGRDQAVEATTDELDKVWAELVARDAGRQKVQGDVEPARHATPRTTRPTSKYFGNRSATDATTGLQNNQRAAHQAPYEWSHLIGDADGGTNRPDNLVAATEAANTEQLILETVQRDYREFLAMNGLRITLTGRATLTGTDPSLPANNAHVANWLRYTVTVSSGAKSVRVLDHVFDAHRQKISKATTTVMLKQAELAIDAALDKEFGVKRARSAAKQKNQKTVPNVPAPPARTLPATLDLPSLQEYLKHGIDRDADNPELLAQLRALLAHGFSQQLLLKALRSFAFPVDELPANWAG